MGSSFGTYASGYVHHATSELHGTAAQEAPGAFGFGGKTHPSREPPLPSPPALPDLADRVAKANNFVEGEFQRLLQSHARLRDAHNTLQDKWHQETRALAQSCEGVRHSLQRLAKGEGECQRAQEVSLPSLFRHNPTGHIEGCADPAEPDELRPTSCTCTAGNPSNGCLEGDDGDHTLRCAHLRREVLPFLKLKRIYHDGGDCVIEKDAGLNKDLLLPGEPKPFAMKESPVEEAIMPPYPLCFLPLPQVVAIPRRGTTSEFSQSRFGRPAGFL